MQMGEVIHPGSLTPLEEQSKRLMKTIGTIDLYIAQRRYKVRRMTICNDHTLDIDAIIKAIAHPVRRDILGWLKEPERHFAEQAHPLEIGVCAGKIFLRTGLSQSTVSAHLTTLQHAGLVTSRKVGQWHFFKRNDELIQTFVERLGQQL
jgi:DNA-binding transcriptional ArsR family regulator